MGTKANPGKFDCYEKADDNEPIFTLRANDRFAPVLVEMWAELRIASGEFDEKAEEAFTCSRDMRHWYTHKKR